MKKIFILIIALFSFSSFADDAALSKDVRSGDLVQAGSTSDTYINVTDAVQTSGSFITYVIVVRSGSIKFAIGSTNANTAVSTEDDKPLFFTARNGNLVYKAASSNDTFLVTTIQ